MKARKANVGGKWVAIERGLRDSRKTPSVEASEAVARSERLPEKLIEKAA